MPAGRRRLRDQRREDVDQLPRRRELLSHVRPSRSRREDGPQADLRLRRRRRREGCDHASAQEQVRLPAALDRRARARGGAGPEGRPRRRGGPGLRDRDERGRERPPRRRLARGRPLAGLRRCRDELRQGARRLQAADRQVPDGAGDDEQHDLRHRGGTAPHLPARVPQGPGRCARGMRHRWRR